MNKKAIFAVAVLVTVGIMLSAATVGAWGPIKPDKPIEPTPGVPVPEADVPDAVVQMVMSEIQQSGLGASSVAANEDTVRSMLAQAMAAGVPVTADMDLGVLGADVGSSDFAGGANIGHKGLHLWLDFFGAAPVAHYAIAWTDTANNLDLYAVAPFGIAISDATGTLTEENAMFNPFGFSLVFVYGQTVLTAPPQPYVVVCDGAPVNP